MWPGTLGLSALYGLACGSCWLCKESIKSNQRATTEYHAIGLLHILTRLIVFLCAKRQTRENIRLVNGCVSGHFLGNNSVLDRLREIGYEVEHTMPDAQVYLG